MLTRFCSCCVLFLDGPFSITPIALLVCLLGYCQVRSWTVFVLYLYLYMFMFVFVSMIAYVYVVTSQRFCLYRCWCCRFL